MRVVMTVVLVVLATVAAPAFAQQDDGVMYKHFRALLIGVPEYRGDGARAFGFGDLEFVKNDIIRMRQVLEKSYGFKMLEVLDSNASRETILKHLRATLVDGVGPDDAVVIYFSGHGYSREFTDPKSQLITVRGFLAPGHIEKPAKPVENLTHDELSGLLVSMDEVMTLVRQSPARSTLILLDSCFSGLAADAKSGRSMSREGKVAAYRDMMARRSWIAMTAGRAGEKAFAHPGKNVSFFTELVAEELEDRAASGKSLPTSSLELFAGLDARARGVPGRPMQNPSYRRLRRDEKDARDAGEFVFVPLGAAPRLREELSKEPPEEPRMRGWDKPRGEQVSKGANEAKSEGRDPAQDPALQEEFRQAQFAAAAGDPQAMAILHEMYANGWGTKPDEEQAYYAARDAATTDEDIGKVLLARCFAQGIFVPKDEQRAKALGGEQLAAKFLSGGTITTADVIRSVWTDPRSPGAGTRDPLTEWNSISAATQSLLKQMGILNPSTPLEWFAEVASALRLVKEAIDAGNRPPPALLSALQDATANLAASARTQMSRTADREAVDAARREFNKAVQTIRQAKASTLRSELQGMFNDAVLRLEDLRVACGLKLD